MPSSIFITRDERDDSPFFKNLRKQGLHVFGQSLIQLDPVDFELTKMPDWFFFYSKNGVRFFFGKKVEIKEVKFAAFGPSTAELIKQLTNKEVSFIGTGDAISTAEAFKKKSQPTDSVCFVRAHHSLQSISKLMGDHCQSDSLIVYNNRMAPLNPTPAADIYVVTSPMNARALLLEGDIKKNAPMIAIGHTTREELEKLGMTNINIADKPNEESLVKAVINQL